ncbi:MAG: hypothetical protein ABL308_12695 [Oceanicaulis sp.]
MTETVLRDQRLFLGGSNLSSQSNSVALAREVAELDRTSLADTARRRRGGLEDGRIGATGFFDASATDAALFGAVGLAGQVVGVTAPDAAEGATAFAAQVHVGEYAPLGGEVGDLAEFNLAAMSDGPIIRGKLNALREVTATGVGAGSELPSVQAGRKLYAALFVTALSAGASLDVLVRSAASDAFSAPATRITFPTIDAVGGFWGVFSGETSHTWFRPSFTLTGDEASASVALILAVQ